MYELLYEIEEENFDENKPDHHQANVAFITSEKSRCDFTLSL
jgi:hypothetical protein